MPKPRVFLDVPLARRDPTTGYTLHGRRFDEPYLWLEQLDDPEVCSWLEAQETASRALLDGLPGRAGLRAAVAGAARSARCWLPIRTGPHGRAFVWQIDAGDDKPKLLLRRSVDAPLELLLDPNDWPAERVLVFAVPAPNGTLVAFGTAQGSTHDALIQVLDVETGQLLSDRPYGHAHWPPAWLPDSSGFFYAACPAPGDVPPGEEAYWNAVYEHRIGADTPACQVFGDATHKAYWCSVKVSECGRFAVLTKWDFVHANAVFLLRLADRALLPVAPELCAITHVQLLGDMLLIHTDQDAPRGRACIAPLTEPATWRTLIPEDPTDTLQSIRGVAGWLYAVYAHAAAQQVRIYAQDGTYLRDMALPGIGSVNRNDGGDTIEGISGAWTGDEVWVRFESYVQPPSLYRYDVATDCLTPFLVPTGGLDPTDYRTEQVWYESRDGTRVSMVLVHHKDLPRNGQMPVRLTGYGGFNIPLQPRFAAVGAAWLKQGGALAFAHVRGGGEYGRAWHAAAQTTRRQTSFDDYIAAARWLVTAGYTSPARLASRGNSHGGMLVAVAALQAPEAFGAVFCRTPTLDMLRFPRFGSLAGAIVEYGSPDDPVEGAYLAGYSPYHTVQAGQPYPTMLFAPALNDRVAPPTDALKMVARLQAEAPQGGPYLLLPLRASGHAGATTIDALIEQDVDELCFFCWAFGLVPPTADAV